MATLKTVIRIEAQGADDAIRKTRSVAREVEDFTKKLNRADFSVISDAEKRLRSADFGVGSKATDGLKAVNNQLALTRQQALTLTYTFNDVAASLASGASPFTILLQQGGQVTQAFGGIRGTFSALAPVVARLAPAIAAVGAAVAAVSFLKMGNDAAKAAVELRNLADRANVSFESFQKLSGVASIKGIAPEDTASGLERLSQALGKASKAYRDLGEGAAADETGKFFDKLGADFRGFTGTSAQVERAIKQLSVGLAGLSGVERFDALQQLRSLVGPDFAQFIARSGRSIDQLAKQYNVAANSISRSDLAIAEQQTAAAAAFGQAWDKASARLSATFTPATLAATRFLDTIRSSGSGAFDPIKSAVESTSNALRDFFLILSGDRAAAQRSPIISGLINAISGIATVANTAATAIGKAYDFIVVGAEVAAKAIGNAFGVEIPSKTQVATAAIVLLIGQITGLNRVILTVAASFATLGASALLNPFVAGIALVAAALLGIVANIDSVKASFARLAEDFDTGVVQRARVWLKLLEAGAAFRPWNTAAYSKAVDEAIALEFKRQDAIKKIADRRIEEDKRAAEQGKTVLGNTVDFVKNLWSDSGAKSFMDDVVSQIGKATQSLSGLSGQARSTIADVRNAGNVAAGAANDAVDSGFQKVAPGRWQKVFDDAQAEADQFVKAGAGRWKAALDGAQEETNRFVRGNDGFWRQVTDSAEQAAAASQKAAEAIRSAKQEQAAPVTAAQQTAQQAPAVQQDQEITTAADKISDVVSSVRTAIAEIAKLGATARDTVGQAGVQAFVSATNTIEQLTASVDRAISHVKELSASVAGIQPAQGPTAGAQQGPQAATQQVFPIDGVRAAISEIAALIVQTLAQAQSFAGLAVATVASGVVGITNPALQSIGSLNEALARAIENVNMLAARLAALPNLPDYSGSSSGSGGGSGFASGGLVLGRGTATSDSIPAWLSNGEFIVRAAAVRKYGVDFLRKINGMSLGGRINLAMPRFAIGGLIQGPGYAAAQQSGRPVTLVLDGKSFGPFTAGGDVIGAVEKHVSMRKLSRTTARVPSRVG